MPVGIIEERGEHETLACLVHVFDHDACSVDVGDVVATFEVAGLFECGHGSTHAGLDIGNAVVPACLTRYLKCRARDCGALLGEIFDSFPNLLYLVHAELSLIEEDKVLVEVLVAIEDEAAGRHGWVAACATCFLDVVLQRVRNVVMHNEADIFFIHSHTEGRGGHDDAHLACHEGILVLHLLAGFHLAVEGERGKAIARETLGEFDGAAGAADIDYGGTSLFADKLTEVDVFVLVAINKDDGIMQVLARG